MIRYIIDLSRMTGEKMFC